MVFVVTVLLAATALGRDHPAELNALPPVFFAALEPQVDTRLKKNGELSTSSGDWNPNRTVCV